MNQLYDQGHPSYESIKGEASPSYSSLKAELLPNIFTDLEELAYESLIRGKRPYNFQTHRFEQMAHPGVAVKTAALMRYFHFDLERTKDIVNSYKLSKVQERRRREARQRRKARIRGVLGNVSKDIELSLLKATKLSVHLLS